MRIYILIALAVPLAVVAQIVSVPPQKIVAESNDHAITVIGSTNQVASYISIKNETGTIFKVGSGDLFLGATTNFVTFGATNNAPTNATTPVYWVAVKINGDTNTYRMPLYR